MVKQINKKHIILLVVLLLSGMLFLEFTSALQESQTVDESPHLAGGYSYLKTGDFRINPEHPPLIKEISAIPLLFLPLRLPTDHKSWQEYNQWEFGRQFLYHNTVDADLILLLGRIPVMLLSLILGIFIFKWANELWGSKVALLALFLYVFEPNILAHSRYVTTDLGVTLFLFLAIYAFYNFLNTNSKKNLIFLAITFGLALTAKFSALILFPLIILFLFLNRLHSNQCNFTIKKIVIIILLLIFTSSIVIFSVYGFETKLPINDLDVKNFYNNQLAVSSLSEFSDQPRLIRKLLEITHPSTAIGNILYSAAQKVPVPAFSYFKGFSRLFVHNYWGHLSYLLGKYSNKGFRYYFPIVFLAKTSLSLLIFLGFGLLCFLYKLKSSFSNSKKYYLKSTNFIKENYFQKLGSYFTYTFERIGFVYRSIPFYYWILILTPLIYFLWALTSRINIGHRHILPVYPFVIMLVSRALLARPKHFNLLWKISFILLLIFYLVSTLLIYPNFLTYFNEAVGGPANGPSIAVDSNIDWGQDILKLKKYLEKNNIKEIYFAYFGSLDVNYYNIRAKPIPTDDDKNGIEELDGIVAISITTLYSKDRNYSWLKKLVPDKKIGYSIYLYDLRNNKN